MNDLVKRTELPKPTKLNVQARLGKPTSLGQPTPLNEGTKLIESTGLRDLTELVPNSEYPLESGVKSYNPALSDGYSQQGDFPEGNRFGHLKLLK